MSLSMAGKYWAEFMTPPGINQKPRKFNPTSGCPNLHKENGKIVGCKTPPIDGVECQHHETSPFGCTDCMNTGWIEPPIGDSYCYQAEMCNRFPEIHKPGYRFHEKRLDQIKLKKPSIVAVGTSGDMWGFPMDQFPMKNKNIKSERWWNLKKIISALRGDEWRHYYIFLTKFPESYSQFTKFLFGRQVGFGTTITAMKDLWRLDEMKREKDYWHEVPSFMKWIMIEPCFFSLNEAMSLPDDIFQGIDWVVIGALKHSNKRLQERWKPNFTALIELVRKASSTNTKVFMKNSTSYCSKIPFFINQQDAREYKVKELRDFKQYPQQFYQWAKQMGILEAMACSK